MPHYLMLKDGELFHRETVRSRCDLCLHAIRPHESNWNSESFQGFALDYSYGFRHKELPTESQFRHSVRERCTVIA